jgi:type IV secretion system protein VirB6
MGRGTRLMAGTCAAIDTTNGIGQPMLTAVDCFMKESVQSGYAMLLGPGSTFNIALTIALTLYVAVIGYRLILGRAGLGIGELAPRVMLIGAVLALATNWAAYQTLVFRVLTDGPQEAALMVAPSADGNSLLARVDTVGKTLIEVSDAWSESDSAATIPTPDAMPSTTPNPVANATPATPPVPATATPPPGTVAILRPSLGPNLLLASALILLLSSVGVMVVAKILLGLLLALGPVFVALALFGATRGLAMGWLRASVLLALVPLLSMMVTAGALNLIEPVMIDLALAARSGEFDLRQAVTLLAEVLVMAAVSVQLFRIATHITAGWTAEFGRGKSTMPNAAALPSSIMSPATDTTSRFDPRMDALVTSIGRSAGSTVTTANPRIINLAATPSPSASMLQGGVRTQPSRDLGRNQLSGRPDAPRPVFRSARETG